MEPRLASGARLGDRFVVLEEVARGGMGVVHRGRDERDGDDVAIKLLGRTSGSAMARFAREARILAEVQHPHVVGYRAHGSDDAGHPWLAMDWLRGMSLSTALDVGMLAASDLVDLAGALCRGLAAVHARGVVHRDVKPSNVFLLDAQPSGAVLLDFGVAHAANLPAITEAGTSVGTPAYMAPEQARGTGDVDIRADLYALGGLLFECLTGRPPFVGATPLAVLAKRLLDDAPPVASLVGGAPPRLAAVVDDLLRRDPERRPRDAHAVLERLEGEELVEMPLVPRLRGPPVGRSATLERRVGSVLLADGGDDDTVTASDARLDQRALRHLAERHGAKLELAAGDAIVLTFTGATAIDTATSAARCALALQAEAPHRAIAVATGYVVLDDDLLAGDAIDRAAAIVAEGAIGIDETTRDLLGERFEVEDVAGERWTLQRERPAMKPGGLPLAGRRRELRRLVRAFDDVVDDGRPLVVEVTGEAGVGKSRLLAEWLGGLAALPASPSVLVATSRPDHRDVPFGVAAQLVQNTSAGDAFLSIWTKPAGAAARDPALLLHTLTTAFRSWLDQVTAAGPTIVVVEDLHWADRLSLEMVGDALEVVADRSLLLVALGRPEMTSRFGELWGRADRVSLRLAPLRVDAAGALLAELEISDDLRPEILRWAEGNPFQLLEMARAALRGHRRVPSTVLAAAQARLDELSAGARRAARAASVFGRSFDPAGVAAVLQVPPARARPWLEELVASGLTAAADPHLRFAHDLLVEATYDTMMPEDRAPAHAAAARFLENRPDVLPETLMRHYREGGEDARAAHWTMRAAERALALGDLSRALELAAPPSGADRETEGRLELVAAEVHTWQGHHDRAAQHAERSLARLELGSVHAFRAAGVLFESAGRSGASTSLVDLDERCWATEPHAGAASERWLTLCRGAQHAMRVGDYARGERGLLRLEGLEPAEGFEGHLHVLQGLVHLHRGRPAAWRASMEEARLAFAEAGDLRMECSLRGESGFAASEQGAFVDAEAMLGPALAQARALGLHHVAAWLCLLRGPVIARVEDVAAGVAVAEEAVALFTKLADPRLEGAAHAYLGALLLEAGARSRAEAEAARARELLAAIPPLVPLALGLAARVAVAGGDAAEGLRLAREARAHIEAAGGVEEGEAQVDLAEVEALEALGDATAAEVARAAAARLEARATSLPVEARPAFLRIPIHAALRTRVTPAAAASAGGRAGSD